MACRILRTPKAVASIRKLPNAQVGNRVREWVNRIADDPEGKTEGLTHGYRVADGMVMGGGGTYYVQVIYAHAPGSGVVTLVDVTCREASGPH